jgi:glycosyltransferase involved in cell wall biosynthesis
MKRPLLSIIIPTRERISALKYTLAAVLALRNENFEILICDNLSNDGTRELVVGYDDPRLHYSCSDTRLTMPQNFERGLRLASGEYITMIGDDDLFIEENLELALAGALKNNCDLVYWNRCAFFWGEYPIENQAGKFFISNGREIFPVDPQTLLTMTYRGLISYQYLPSIYNSICKRTFLNNYSTILRGAFFPDYVVSVDVFSSLVLCALNPNVWYLESPASLSGISRHSNGMSVITGGEETKKFALELGYTSNSEIMPRQFFGKVAATTVHGISQLGLLTDYFSVVEKILKYTCKSPPSLDILTSIFLRRLGLDQDIAILPQAADFQEIMQRDLIRHPVVREDVLTYFFRLWSIPSPSYYTGSFEGNLATSLDLHRHLVSTGFNKPD